MTRLWQLLRMDTDEFEARYPEAAAVIAAVMVAVILAGLQAGCLLAARAVQ